jgi:hypothetical protein
MTVSGNVVRACIEWVHAVFPTSHDIATAKSESFP